MTLEFKGNRYKVDVNNPWTMKTRRHLFMCIIILTLHFSNTSNQDPLIILEQTQT